MLTNLFRRHVIFHSYISGTRRHITVVIGNGKGYGITSDMRTIKRSLTRWEERSTGNNVRTTVKISSYNTSLSVSIQLYGNILTNRLRRNVIFHSYISGTRRHITVVIGNGKGYEITSAMRTIKSSMTCRT